MSNMSYCRFSNTSKDLQDCVEFIRQPLSLEEHKARKVLVDACIEILEGIGYEIDDSDAISVDDLPVEA